MNKTVLLSLLGVALISGGCVATTYKKEITVRKDANGNIIETIETEGVTQPNQSGWPVKFQYLKGVIPGEEGNGGQKASSPKAGH